MSSSKAPEEFVIFLANKLTTCDTIVPFMVTLSAMTPRTRFHFVTLDERTYLAIERNVVLFDAINSIGTLTMRGRPRAKHGSFVYLLGHRLHAFFWMLELLFKAIRGKTRFIHFKQLNEWPMRLLAEVAPKSTVFVEGTAVGVTPLEWEVSGLMQPRNVSGARPMGHYLIHFSDHWRSMHRNFLEGKAVRKMVSPFSNVDWVAHLQSVQDDYFNAAFANVGKVDPGGPIAVFILSWMGPNGLLSEPDLFPQLFEETLDILEDSIREMPLLVKPHPACSEEENARVAETLAKRTRLNSVVTHLHPMLLAQRARFAIGNVYSTTFSVIRFMNVPTVEYTDYNARILDATDRGSMRPEFVSKFINRDPEALRAALQDMLAASWPLPKPEVTRFSKEDIRMFMGDQYETAPRALGAANSQSQFAEDEGKDAA